MLAELVAHVIGVDTHKDTHTAAVVASTTGGVEGIETALAAADGYEALVEFADLYSSADKRAWAIEGTGSYGAGLTAFLGPAGSGSSRSTARSVPRSATAPSPTSSTPCEPPGRRSVARNSPNPGPGATARPCGA